eukprot:2865645-Pleurochrysis_carterae.AAC.2
MAVEGRGRTAAATASASAASGTRCDVDQRSDDASALREAIRGRQYAVISSALSLSVITSTVWYGMVIAPQSRM